MMENSRKKSVKWWKSMWKKIENREKNHKICDEESKENLRKKAMKAVSKK